MTKIFDNKNYPSVMYLLIVIMIVLLFFNFVGIVDNSDKGIEHEKLMSIKTTSLAISGQIGEPSIKPEGKYYLFLGCLGGLIIAILINLISVIKKNKLSSLL